MGVLIRALTYATVFVGVFLIVLPAQVLSEAGITAPARWGVPQMAGMATGVVGGATALWCVLSFAFWGRGTPAPFDLPRRLVVRGPYRYVRNLMCLGGSLVLAGAALFNESTFLCAYAAGFLLVLHIFVVLYEEPTLRKTFRAEYEAYCRGVGRWWPRRRAAVGPDGRC